MMNNSCSGCSDRKSADLALRLPLAERAIGGVSGAMIAIIVSSVVVVAGLGTWYWRRSRGPSYDGEEGGEFEEEGNSSFAVSILSVYVSVFPRVR